jgi:regulator of chromosome condensation
VVRAAAGKAHSFVIDSLGDIWSWGVNFNGQAAINDQKHTEVIDTPHQVPTMSKGSPTLGGSHVVDISCGDFHSMFLLEDGRVFSCGKYTSGQLGLGPEHILKSENEKHHPHVQSGITVPREIRFPFPSGTPEKIIGIEAGYRRSMAWTESHLFAWGMGNVSELGLGHITEAFQPTLVDVIGHKPVHVSCGGQHTLALFTGE